MRILVLALFFISAMMTKDISGLDTSCSSNSRVKFSRTETCPSSSKLQHLQKLEGTHSIAFCIFRCAASSNCRVIFKSTEGTCYFGTSTQLSEIFSSANQPESALINQPNQSDCRSYVKNVETEQPSTAQTVPTTAAQTVTTTGAQTVTTTGAQTVTTTGAQTVTTTGAQTVTTTAAQTVTTTGAQTVTTTAAQTVTTTAAQTVPTTAAQAVTTTGAPPTVSGLDSALTSKLLMLFDFRQSYKNLVNSAKYMVTPQGSVSRDSRGADFAGVDSSDCIDVDNDGGTLVSDYLTHTKNFTFFARLTRQTTNTQIYHYFHDCSTTNTRRGLFGDKSGKLYAEHVFESAGTRVTRQSSGIVLSVDDTPQTASAAAVFASGSLTNFYFNGSFIGQGTDTGLYPSGNPACLRLGYTGAADGSLRGRLICYAIAKAALSATELQQLDTYCQSSH